MVALLAYGKMFQHLLRVYYHQSQDVMTKRLYVGRDEKSTPHTSRRWTALRLTVNGSLSN
jgi:hypothetical protein